MMRRRFMAVRVTASGRAHHVRSSATSEPSRSAREKRLRAGFRALMTAAAAEVFYSMVLAAFALLILAAYTMKRSMLEGVVVEVCGG